jgi:hypothetical protein
MKLLLCICLAIGTMAPAYAEIDLTPNSATSEVRQEWTNLTGHDLFGIVYWLKSINRSWEEKMGCDIKIKAGRTKFQIRLIWRF